MRLIWLAPLVLGLAALAACIGGRIPPTTYYRLVGPTCQPQEYSYPFELAITRLRANPVYQDTALLYMPSAYETASYGYSRWEAMPADMLTERLYQYLRECRLFQSVSLRSLSGKPDLLLRGRITRFAEVDEPEGAFAELTLEMELVCLSSPKKVWEGELAARTPMSERTPQELARAMSASLAAVLEKMAARLSPALSELEEEGCLEAGSAGQADGSEETAVSRTEK